MLQWSQNMMPLCTLTADVMELAPCLTLHQTTSQRTTAQPRPATVTRLHQCMTDPTGETVTTLSPLRTVPSCRCIRDLTQMPLGMRVTVSSGTEPTGWTRRTPTQTRWEPATETTLTWPSHSMWTGKESRMDAWRGRSSSSMAETTDQPLLASCQRMPLQPQDLASSELSKLNQAVGLVSAKSEWVEPLLLKTGEVLCSLLLPSLNADGKKLYSFELTRDVIEVVYRVSITSIVSAPSIKDNMETSYHNNKF